MDRNRTPTGSGTSRTRRNRAFLCKLGNEQYETLLQLAQGTFDLAKSKRTQIQKNAVRQYQRRKGEFSVVGGELFFRGKTVLTTGIVGKEVKLTYKDTLGSGGRTTWQKLKKTRAGVPLRTVKGVLSQSKQYQMHRPLFKNTIPLKPVTARKVNERWQVDLIVMEGDEVLYHGKTYRYILSVLDVFSRFQVLRPLVRKSSACTANALETVFAEHGYPKIVQCDRGPEFNGSFRRLLQKRGIKQIKSRSYHPQSQGKCERSHHEVRSKIAFAQAKQGFNWASKLHKVQEAINNCPKEVLGQATPAEVKANQKKKRLMKKVVAASHRANVRMVMRNKTSATFYRKGDKVLIRYPEARKGKVPRRRHILKGVVAERNLTEYKYKVRFQTPDGKGQCRWISVVDITSETVQSENEKQSRRLRDELKRDKQLHRQKYTIPVTHSDRVENFEKSQVKVLFNPTTPVGNCQFDAVAHQLSLFGIFRTGQQLRQEAVRHISELPLSYNNFIAGDPARYEEEMKKPSTYGDHVTLLALSRLYNVQFLIVSADGAEYSVLVSPDGEYYDQMFLLTLGYFPEGKGEHYVSIDLGHLKAQLLAHACRDGRQGHSDDDGRQGQSDDDGRQGHSDDGRQGHSDDDGRQGQGDDGRQGPSVGQQAGPDDQHLGHDAEYLPREIQMMIIHHLLAESPASRYTLESVSSFFRHVVSSVPLPRIYINSTVLTTVPNPVSVRRLVQAAGRGSGLALEIRRILANPRWYNAWLWLQPELFQWYSVVNVWYRSRQGR